MRFQSVVFPAFLAASGVSAFPTSENLMKMMSVAKVQRCPFADIKDGVEKAIQKRSLLDPLSSPIEVTGEHQFVPPDFAAGDQRGPCPGLNALANHGYIPHNGVVSLAEVVPAINQVWGMALDLGLILGVMGTVWVGDPISLNPSFSIAGESPAIEDLLNNVFGILGTPRGLNGSHNFIESDSSPFRDDLYLTGDAWTLNLTKFQHLYDMSTDGTFSMDLMAEFAKDRYYESVATNPNFYYGPFTGAIARNAGYIFAGRLFRNHSVENPEGVLTKDVLKSIFGVSGPDNALQYTYGHERIPENWYRRPVDFGLVELNLDLLGMAGKYPELLNIGGNVGSVNTFSGVDLSNLTGGLLNAANLLEGNNLLCFAFEVVKTVSPNVLTNIFSTIAAPLELITNALATPLLDLACPAFKDITYNGEPLWEGLQSAFPGAGWANAVL
ncbi:oxidase, putative [Talaromyces stipitatus ATCC 10500]|uniref:Oxidase, putative n=1 Tax=Talaromyces stipitatus (strain ATCC 10500 / CBS 375.48 / QM 6759 / NRRL 1006) TaxID=441959 RepID=B8MBG0_TALSN|nr:oxidase, putative [Talaromyces stipitatus ATCC 10500]EED17824.1 oxidase, putative [Talaromyces stipitatus ATCC 10500]